MPPTNWVDVVFNLPKHVVHESESVSRIDCHAKLNVVLANLSNPVDALVYRWCAKKATLEHSRRAPRGAPSENTVLAGWTLVVALGKCLSFVGTASRSTCGFPDTRALQARNP